MIRGPATVQGQIVQQGQTAVLSNTGDAVTLHAHDGNATMLWLSGQPILEPIAGYGPFVMNTREEIMQAMQDFQAGRMGTLAAQ